LTWEETDAADAVTRFVKGLSMPTRLIEVGVTDQEDLKRVAEKTLTDI